MHQPALNTFFSNQESLILVLRSDCARSVCSQFFYINTLTPCTLPHLRSLDQIGLQDGLEVTANIRFNKVYFILITAHLQVLVKL
jgi:hypothetical protein